MQVQVEKTEPCKAHVSFTVPADEFAAEVRRMLVQVGRRTRMKGFRPGKVPPGVIERLHGEAVRREARESFVQKAYQQALGENDLRPFSHPQIDLGQAPPPADGDFSLEFDVTLRPEFELGQYRGLEVESSLAAVGDEEVEAALEQLRLGQARPEPAGDEGLPEDGMALCKVELLHEGEVVFTREGLRLGPGTAVPGVDPEAFKQALLGLADGQTAELALTFPDDFEVEPARGSQGLCRVVVNQAFRIVVPTREQLPAQLGLEDDAALVARLRERLEQAHAEQEHQRIEGELLTRVIDAHQLELPAGMLAEQIRQRLEQVRGELASQGLEGDELEAQLATHEPRTREAAERASKAFFLIEAIAEAEKLQVGEADLRAELEQIAERNRAELSEVTSYYQEQQLLPQLAMEIAERKVRAFLRENARLKSPGA